ncbi:hypothetical protein [Azohydromonas aeria]|uniref:hypothetical protein n=1 Tax=Azohydromonas aeria TaxID=2590212 RepID=UPI0012FABFBF|nr:hypothetical protein [Azohydromonas aeria]
MEKLERSEALLALGKRLVKTLSSDEDLISDWMAHLIAERMQAVEAASPDQRPAAQEACAREIVRLWQHRYTAPAGVNALADLLPLAQTIESLQPGEHRFRYAARVLGLAANEKGESRSGWLDFAMQADRTARDVIRFALHQAAAEVTDDGDFKRALNEALGAEMQVTFELQLIELLGQHRGEQAASQQRDDAARADAARLEAFAAAAMQVAADLRSSCTADPDPHPAARPADKDL